MACIHTSKGLQGVNWGSGGVPGDSGLGPGIFGLANMLKVYIGAMIFSPGKGR